MPHDAHIQAGNKAAVTLCTNLAWTPPTVQAPGLSEIISAVVWWAGLWAKHRDRVSNLVFYTQSTIAVISGTGDRTQRVKVHSSSTTVGRKEVTSGMSADSFPTARPWKRSNHCTPALVGGAEAAAAGSRVDASSSAHVVWQPRSWTLAAGDCGNLNPVAPATAAVPNPRRTEQPNCQRPRRQLRCAAAWQTSKSGRPQPRRVMRSGEGAWSPGSNPLHREVPAAYPHQHRRPTLPVSAARRLKCVRSVEPCSSGSAAAQRLDWGGNRGARCCTGQPPPASLPARPPQPFPGRSELSSLLDLRSCPWTDQACPAFLRQQPHPSPGLTARSFRSCHPGSLPQLTHPSRGCLPRSQCLAESCPSSRSSQRWSLLLSAWQCSERASSVHPSLPCPSPVELVRPAPLSPPPRPTPP